MSTSVDSEIPIGGSVEWVAGLLVGSIGAVAATLAVALVGLLMMQGRLPVRRGATVIVGCFILFSARAIAEGLVSSAAPGSSEADVEPVAPAPPPSYQPSAPPVAPEDPYGGAAAPPPEPSEG